MRWIVRIGMTSAVGVVWILSDTLIDDPHLAWPMLLKSALLLVWITMDVAFDPQWGLPVTHVPFTSTWKRALFALFMAAFLAQSVFTLLSPDGTITAAVRASGLVVAAAFGAMFVLDLTYMARQRRKVAANAEPHAE